MFPNPQDALPLPPRPDLEQYKKLAKELVKACRTGDAGAVGAWASKWLAALMKAAAAANASGDQAERWITGVEQFARRTLANDPPASCTLAGAQFVIARSHGFQSWPRFVEHLRGLAKKDSAVSAFEAAADAMVAGDLAALKRLLRENPVLARQRSTREHHATLLHYVSANGIENYRQKTPKNIVEITGTLLQAGAEVDAGADVYGGGCTTLGLVATSVHPERAGVQEQLMQLLLDHGAAVDKPGLAGRTHSLVVACLANGRPRAAKFLAQRGAPLDLEAAAGIGRLDVVQSFFDSDGRLKPPASQQQLQRGFLWACEYGDDDVVEFLLARGADLRDAAGTGEPALHMAVVGAKLSTVKLLLAHGAPLEELNAYGGTALGQAGWSFINGDPEADYVPIFEALLSAGAKIEDGWLAWLEKQKGRSAEAKQRVAAVLRRYGATT